MCGNYVLESPSENPAGCENNLINILVCEILLPNIRSNLMSNCVESLGNNLEKEDVNVNNQK